MIEPAQQTDDDDVILASGEMVDQIMAEDDANDPNLASYEGMTSEE